MRLRNQPRLETYGEIHYGLYTMSEDTGQMLEDVRYQVVPAYVVDAAGCQKVYIHLSSSPSISILLINKRHFLQTMSKACWRSMNTAIMDSVLGIHQPHCVKLKRESSVQHCI